MLYVFIVNKLNEIKYYNLLKHRLLPLKRMLNDQTANRAKIVQTSKIKVQKLQLHLQHDSN